MKATMNAAGAEAADAKIAAGVFYGHITAGTPEPSDNLIAGILHRFKREAEFPQPEDESDFRLMYCHTAARWLEDNAVRRLNDSQASIRQAREESYEEVDSLSRLHAALNARDLVSQKKFYILFQDEDLAADAQSVYRRTRQRIQDAGITVANLNPAQVQLTMNNLAAEARLQDIDQNASSAEMAALEVARLASMNLRVIAGKLTGFPQWGHGEIGETPERRMEALGKFTAECYGLAAASIHVINLIAAG